MLFHTLTYTCQTVSTYMYNNGSIQGCLGNDQLQSLKPGNNLDCSHSAVLYNEKWLADTCKTVNKCNFKQRKPDQKEYMVFDCIYIK